MHFVSRLSLKELLQMIRQYILFLFNLQVQQIKCLVNINNYMFIRLCILKLDTIQICCGIFPISW